MSNTGGVPDAWDDDWVASADNSAPATVKSTVPAKLTKAERRAQHADQQKKLWDGADNPGRNLWLEAQGAVPNRQELKPQVTLLSRKPPQIAKKSVSNGVANLSIEDEDDSEEEARKKHAADMQERQRRAKQEHEEKQRRYAEARERIMGTSKQPSSTSQSRESSHGRDAKKSRPKHSGNNRNSQPETPAEHSPARNSPGDRKQLFDPDDMGRRLAPRREVSEISKEDVPIRQPRGPEGGARGGFGFAARGASSTASAASGSR